MIKRRNIYLILFFLIILSCEKPDDYSKTKIDYRYQASFSIPVGDTNLNIERNAVNMPLLWQTYPMLIKTIDTIRFRHTIEYNFSKIIFEIDKIKLLRFSVLTLNDFPAEAAIYLYFADSMDNVRDSLKNGLIIIPNAEIANDGSIIKRGNHLQNIEINKDQFQNWGNIRNIIFNGYITNMGQDTNLYKYYSKYNLFIGMGLQVDFDFIYHL